MAPGSTSRCRLGDSPDAETDIGGSRATKEGDRDVGSCDVVLVDDHPMLAAGLISGLESHGITMLTTPVLEISAALDFIDDHQPQLVLLDFHVPPIGTSEVFSSR